jgi:hypothetical protein
MQELELHIITFCAVLVALEPLGALLLRFQNWNHRRLNAAAKKAGITR